VAQQVKGIGEGEKREGEQRWVEKGRWKNVGKIGG